MDKKRKSSGFTLAPVSPRKKCAMKMKKVELEKNDVRVKMLLIGGESL